MIRYAQIWALVVLVLPALRQFGGIFESVGFLRLEEALAVALIPVSLRGLWLLVRSGGYARAFLGFYLLYLGFSIAGAAMNGHLGAAAALQLSVELKLPFVVGVAFGVTHSARYLRTILQAGIVALVVSVPFIVIQYASPEFYTSVFPGANIGPSLVLAGGDGVSKATGIFWFAGSLAVVSSAMLAISVFELKTGPRSVTLSLVGLCASCLALSLSRQEIGAIGVGIGAVLLFESRSMSSGVKKAATVGVVAVLVGMALIAWNLMGPEAIAGYARGLEDLQQVRLTLLGTGFDIAVENLPFGSGLGTFGGVGAAVLGSEVYQAYGFEAFEWFQDSRALTDSYWAHLIGEAGLAGAASWLVSLSCLVMMALDISGKIDDPDIRTPLLTGAAGVIFLVLSAVASSVPTSLFALVLTASWLGMARTVLMPVRDRGVQE